MTTRQTITSKGTDVVTLDKDLSLCGSGPRTRLLLDLVLSLYKEDYLYQFLNVCLFDYTAFVVSGKAGIP